MENAALRVQDHFMSNLGLGIFASPIFWELFDCRQTIYIVEFI